MNFTEMTPKFFCEYSAKLHMKDALRFYENGNFFAATEANEAAHFWFEQARNCKV